MSSINIDNVSPIAGAFGGIEVTVTGADFKEAPLFTSV